MPLNQSKTEMNETLLIINNENCTAKNGVTFEQQAGHVPI